MNWLTLCLLLSNTFVVFLQVQVVCKDDHHDPFMCVNVTLLCYFFQEKSVKNKLSNHWYLMVNNIYIYIYISNYWKDRRQDWKFLEKALNGWLWDTLGKYFICSKHFLTHNKWASKLSHTHALEKLFAAGTFLKVCESFLLRVKKFVVYVGQY